ncbi:hypothetical protein SOV_17480 [Sporomusa ovata DSM 2662]|uniref:Uncharacterized protein n=1 Tax=Sporomusa ovata TaxID=2378 RepID=A0A0U1KVT8_9FIRM|nr:hypothetical protein [Sporomusa ovata]EQB29348.1 hypothetical protein SOV_1c10810 [Sporomusa ovata DSM 2662]CQR71395.1 hypothetical protein SpAn4DRAFT_3900 [Sporomusa ovata]
MLKKIGLRLLCFFIEGNIAEGQVGINLINLSIAAAFFAAGFIVGKI